MVIEKFPIRDIPSANFKMEYYLWNSPLERFLVASQGLKSITGIAQTSCNGAGSHKHNLFWSQPPPSRNKPRTYTPSCRQITFDCTVISHDIKVSQTSSKFCSFIPVTSIFIYGIAVWGGASSMKKILKVQKTIKDNNIVTT